MPIIPRAGRRQPSCAPFSNSFTSSPRTLKSHCFHWHVRLWREAAICQKSRVDTLRGYTEGGGREKAQLRRSCAKPPDPQCHSYLSLSNRPEFRKQASCDIKKA